MGVCDYCREEYDIAGGSDDIWLGEYRSKVCYKCVHKYVLIYERALYKTKDDLRRIVEEKGRMDSRILAIKGAIEEALNIPESDYRKSKLK